jgi:hypothetical protein
LDYSIANYGTDNLEIFLQTGLSISPRWAIVFIMYVFLSINLFSRFFSTILLTVHI